MRVLLLSPYPEKLTPALQACGDSFLSQTTKVDLNFLKEEGVEWIVSYGYRHLIKGPILSQFRNRILNLHISYLPWNAGADPNFWSFFEGTPKGVTLHFIDEGLDSGNILIQKKVEFAPTGETLATTYEKLRQSIEKLFYEEWPRIRLGNYPSKEQEGKGTSHSLKDKDTFAHLLTHGWDTPIQLIEKAGIDFRKQ